MPKTKLHDSYLAPFLLYMATFIACVVLGAAIPACGSIDCKDPKNASNVKCVPADVISCASAEAKAISDGKDVLQIGLEIAGKITSAYDQAKAAGGDTTAAIEAALAVLFSAYGEPVVACVMHDLLPVPGTTPATGQPSPLQTAVSATITQHKWKFAK